MKKLGVIGLLLCMEGMAEICHAGFGDGRIMPLKSASAYEMDMNQDKANDLILVVGTGKGRELIVLMKNKNSYQAYFLANLQLFTKVTCHYGDSIKASSSTGKSREEMAISTGCYIKATDPEGPASVFFWNGNTFKETWTAE